MAKKKIVVMTTHDVVMLSKDLTDLLDRRQTEVGMFYSKARLRLDLEALIADASAKATRYESDLKDYKLSHTIFKSVLASPHVAAIEKMLNSVPASVGEEIEYPAIFSFKLDVQSSVREMDVSIKDTVREITKINKRLTKAESYLRELNEDMEERADVA